jgi:hypothetical protein
VNSNFETVYAAVDNTSSKVDAVTNKVNPLSNNISVDGSGNLTVLHDLKVSGRLHGFKLTPEYTAYRYPGPGTTTTQMIAAATGYCFLTQAYHHGSFESCYVDINSGYWEVHASALGTGEEASCGARCIIGPLD